MKTSKLNQVKEGILQNEQYTLPGYAGIKAALPSKSSNGIEGGDNTRKRRATKQDDANLWEQETDKGIVKAFARQVSFSGVVYIYTIFLPTNSHLWSKLPDKRTGGKKAYKTRLRLVK